VKDPEVLSNEEIADLLPNLAMIKSWCDSVARHAEKLALSGVPIEGYKLVTSRTNRKWADEQEAIKAMTLLTNEPVMSRKPISPSKAVAMLGKDCDSVNALIVKPEGRPTLVPVSDKRPALEATDGFDAIDD
jgi:hypothetical protein